MKSFLILLICVICACPDSSFGIPFSFGQHKTFINDSASTLIRNGFAKPSAKNAFLIQSQSFTINGSFYVDKNLVLKDCDIKLGQMTEIVLMPNDTLTILGSYLRGCDTLWDGIKMTANSEKVIIKRSLIEDATNVVYSSNGGHYDIDSTVFNKNHRGVLLTNNTGTMLQADDYNLHHSIFTCRDFYTLYGSVPVYGIARAVITDYRTHHNTSSLFGKTSMLNHVRSFTGIETNNISNALPVYIPFGDSTYIQKDNIFDYMDYGIIVAKSNVQIYNNMFENFTTYRPIHGAMNVPSTAIYAAQNDNNDSLIVGGFGAHMPNKFDTCFIGVEAIDYNANVINNKFDNDRTGVFINTISPRNVNILNNKMKKVSYGVYCYDIGLDTTKINNNNIKKKTLNNIVFSIFPILLFNL